MAPIPKEKGRSVPQCVRCRNHGVTVKKKDHKKNCGFKGCKCDKCELLIQRKDVESKIKIEEQKERDKHRNGKQRREQRAETAFIAKTNGKPFNENRKIKFDYDQFSSGQFLANHLQHRTGYMDQSVQSFGLNKGNGIHEKDWNYINDNNDRKYTVHTIDNILGPHQKMLGTASQIVDGYNLIVRQIQMYTLTNRTYKHEYSEC